MHCQKLCLLLCCSALMWWDAPQPAAGQIVRRYPGGGVSVRAPFVRVDVGPYGGTSVRAPFVAVDDPGGVYIGPRRRLLRRPRFAEAPPYYGQVETTQPTLATRPPLPTAEELAALDLVSLVGTLRDLSRALQEALQRFDDPTGWQRYLALPEDALGAPGTDEVAIQLSVLQERLERYDQVATGGKFAKIAEMPSFVATHTALELVVARFAEAGPVLGEPDADDWRHDPGPITEEIESEPLPAPLPQTDPRRGERSILKRR